MMLGADFILVLAGVAMLVLALWLPCASGGLAAARLGSAHAAALAIAALAQSHAASIARGQWVLPLLALLVAVKAVAVPWLLPGDARGRDTRAGAPLPVLACGVALVVLAWVALPPVAGLRPMTVPLAVAMLALGVLPAALRQGAARRFLGLLVAADGAMLAALHVADPMRAVLLELGVLALLGALLAVMRWERDTPRTET